MMRTTGRRCDRAREYASLRLDGELSDFERVLLDSHLDRCPSCRGFADDLVGVTESLRMAPLEQPTIAITLPRRRFVALRGIHLGAAAAAVVSVVGMGTLFGLLQSSTTTSIPGFPQGRLDGRRGRRIPRCPASRSHDAASAQTPARRPRRSRRLGGLGETTLCRRAKPQTPSA